MKTRFGLRRVPICVAAIGLAVRVYADTSSTPGHAPGAIVGVVRNPEKLPVSGATVTAVRSDGGAIRATLPGSDGIYSFADLPPGTWNLTLQSDGYPEVQVTALQVVASKATRYDVVMSVSSVAAAPKSAAQSATETAASAATVSEALQAPDAGPEVDTKTPWAQVGYVGWMNGTPPGSGGVTPPGATPDRRRVVSAADPMPQRVTAVPVIGFRICAPAKSWSERA